VGLHWAGTAPTAPIPWRLDWRFAPWVCPSYRPRSRCSLERPGTRGATGAAGAAAAHPEHRDFLGRVERASCAQPLAFQRAVRPLFVAQLLPSLAGARSSAGPRGAQPVRRVQPPHSPATSPVGRDSYGSRTWWPSHIQKYAFCVFLATREGSCVLPEDCLHLGAPPHRRRTCAERAAAAPAAPVGRRIAPALERAQRARAVAGARR